MSPTLKWLLIILVAVIVLGGGYLVYAKYGKGATTPTTSPSPVAVTSPSASAKVSPSVSVPADWKTYTNRQLGFSFKYPNTWKVADDKTLTLDAEFTVLLNSGSEFALNVSEFQSVSKMFGVTGATSITDYINKKVGYYDPNSIISTPLSNSLKGFTETKVSRISGGGAPSGGEGAPAGKEIFITAGGPVFRFVFNEQGKDYSETVANQVISSFYAQ